MEGAPARDLPAPRAWTAASGSAPPRLRPRNAREGAAAVLLLTGVVTILLFGVVGAVFTSTTAGPSSSLTAASLNSYLPTAVTASRTTSTTCLVSWTPAAGAPGGLTYDITDGSSTVATNRSGTSATVTVPTTAVTPTVKARYGSWVSAGASAASAACRGFPDAPGVTLTPAESQVSATWTAPAANGGTLASYTATISPAPGSGSATCTVSVPTTSCAWSALTNGVTYTVSVTATSDVGTGPAAAATAVPYPSGVMSSSALKLWLDGADAASMYAASGCSGAAASSTVGCWKDKSASANNATQASGAARPGLTTVASRSVPSFDGTSSSLGLNPAALPTGTGSSTAFSVATLTDPAPASSGNRTILSHGSAAAGQARELQKANLSAAARVAAYGSGSITGTLSSSAAVLAGEWTSSAVTAWKDGTAAVTTGVSVNTGSAWAAVGSQAGSSQFWQGAVPEVIVLDGTLTTAQRRAVEDYLARKWSVTIAPQAPTGLTGAATTASSTSANVSWTAPAWDGGASVQSYTVTAVPVGGGSTVTCGATAPATTCTLTGLVGSGTQYTITVTATNSAGTGPASSSFALFSGVPSGASAKLWLAADDLDGDGAVEASSESGLVSGSVQTWKDKSGGARDVTAPSTGERPTYTSRTINSLSVPTFDGTTVLTGAGSNPYAITGDRSLFVVTRERSFYAGATAASSSGSYAIDRSPVDNPVFSLKGCSGTWSVRYQDDGAGSPGCASSGTAPSANRVDLVTGIRSGSGIRAWVSGAPGTSTTFASTITQRGLSIGRHGSTTTTGHDVDVAEVLLYDTALSGGSRRAVEKYLAAKWGVSLAPDVPTSASAIANGSFGQATVTWTAPTDVGGSALTGYTARTSPGGFTCTATPPATTCTLAGLSYGVAYAVTATATNSAGTSDDSAPASITLLTVPDPPTGVSTSAGDAQATVSWTAPAFTGGSAVTGYTATGVPSDNTLPTRTCSNATSPCTLTGLTNGVQYSVTVTATNAQGTGAASAAATVVPYPSGILSSSAMRLWLDGADSSTMFQASGCSTAVTAAGQAVACWQDKSGQGNHVTQATSTNQPRSASTTLSRLVPDFDGTDDTLTRSSSTLPTGTSASTTFAAATNESANPGAAGQQAMVFIGQVGSTGGGRSLHKGTTSATLRTNASSTTSAVDGTVSTNAPLVAASTFGSGAYSLRAFGRPAVSQSYAYNTTSSFVGLGTSSAPWDGTVKEVVVLNSALSAADTRTVTEYLARKWGTPITPQVVQSPGATPGNATATVSWTAPSWDGGASVSSYTVTPNGGAGTCTWSSGTTASCTGLANGTSYTFTVTANNSVGAGEPATTSSVTPAQPPNAPTGVSATAGDTQATVAWTAPAWNGGATITSYTATAVPSDGTLPTRTCSSAASPCTVTGLTNGVTYSVTVTATNWAGTGSASSAASVIPYPATIMSASGMRLWLDGADSSTIFQNQACSTPTTAAGQDISCWTDKSGQGNDVANQAGGQQPLAASTLSRLVPKFDGGNDSLSKNTTTLPTGTSDSTIFTVGTTLSANPATSGQESLFWMGNGATGAARHVYKASGSAAVRVTSGATTDATDSVFTSSSPVLAAATFATVAGNGSYTLNALGRPSTSVSYNYSTSGTATYVGSGGATLDGTVQEVVVLNAALTAANRRTMEEYLARKWAVTITPSAVQSLTVTPGTGTASLSWTAPSWNGGASVTGYTATVSGGGSCTVTGTTASCTGIPAGSRTFTVTATNSVGTGFAATATATVS